MSSTVNTDYYLQSFESQGNILFLLAMPTSHVKLLLVFFVIFSASALTGKCFT